MEFGNLFSGTSVGIWAAGAAMGYMWKPIKNKLKTVILGVPDAIEKALNVDIPDQFEHVFDNAMKTAIDAVDQSLSNGAFWRNIARKVKNNKGDEALEQFLDVFKNVDVTKSIEGQIPAEYKEMWELFNTTRTEMAAEGIKNYLKSRYLPVLGEEKTAKIIPPDHVIETAIKSRVLANKVLNSVPVTLSPAVVVENVEKEAEKKVVEVKKTMEQVLMETRERIRKLKESKPS